MQTRLGGSPSARTRLQSKDLVDVMNGNDDIDSADFHEETEQYDRKSLSSVLNDDLPAVVTNNCRAIVKILSNIVDPNSALDKKGKHKPFMPPSLVKAAIWSSYEDKAKKSFISHWKICPGTYFLFCNDET
jgi:hypothetical protein